MRQTGLSKSMYTNLSLCDKDIRIHIVDFKNQFHANYYYLIAVGSTMSI